MSFCSKMVGFGSSAILDAKEEAASKSSTQALISMLAGIVNESELLKSNGCIPKRNRFDKRFHCKIEMLRKRGSKEIGMNWAKEEKNAEHKADAALVRQ